jgi:MFS family permease
MYSEDDLAAAVKAGVVPHEMAEALRRFVAERQHAPAVDEEHFRLVTGFNDIFVVIACILLLSAVGWIGGALAGPLGLVLVSASAWGLAEFFVRRRRMALPAIVLLLVFVGGVWVTLFRLLQAAGLDVSEAIAGGGAVAALAAWLHWRRFQVPITVAAGTAAAAGCIGALVLVAVPSARNWASVISLVMGVAVFALAMRWDMADARRETRKSDVAFWLHLLAAPLLVHPAFSVLGVLQGQTGLPQALAVVTVYVVIAVVSLAIDRRALMVSALAYVLYTFSKLLEQFGMVNLSFALTALVIGSGLLLLSAFWQRSRGFVLRHAPPAVSARLAPLR